MADIDQILSGGAGASSRADFSNLFSGGFDAYNAGKDQKFKNDLREAFKDGIPTTPDGQPDFGAMSKVLMQKGAIDQGIATSNLDLQRQNLKFGQGQSAGIQSVEGGAQPSNIVSPVSANRSATETVAAPLNKGGATPQGNRAQPRQATIMQVLAAQNIPNDQIGAATTSIARQLGVDPTQPLNMDDPQVRNVLVPAVQRFKQMGLGQVQPPQPGDNPPQAQPAMQAQPGPQMAQAPQQYPQAAQPAPGSTALTGTAAPAPPSRAQQLIAMYAGILSDPRSPKNNVELAKTRLDALQRDTSLTEVEKNYAHDVAQGYRGTLLDYQAETESRKTGATEEAKLGAAKYQTLVDSGVKAQQEIPQIELLQTQMNDPNFFSGIGEKYNLAYKRLKSAAGIDPDAAVPQEFLRKATAASVLGSFGALKGLGPIRVAEMNLAKQAAAAPDNSIPANKLLVEIQKRTYQRQADIAEMAQNYKEQNGTLDAGFDKKVTAYFKAHPIFNDAEIQDFHKAIGEAPKTTTAAASAPAQFPNARKAPDGNFYVPDPQRPGKYLKVVQ